MLKQIAVVQMELGMSFGIGMRMYLANWDDVGQKGRHYYLVAK